MQKLSQVDHSNMDNHYNITDPAKSGFNLTYNSHVGGLVMGRLYPQSFQKIMPGDKFSGRNDYSLIAEQLVTPIVSDVNVSQHNFFVTFRSIDKGFEDLLTPTKLNGMSNSLSAPTFKLTDIVSTIFTTFNKWLPYIVKPSGSFVAQFAFNNFYNANYTASDIASTIRSSSFYLAAQKFYCEDAFEDLIQQLTPLGAVINGFTSSSSAQEIQDAFVNFWCCIFDFFCGEGSNMDYLGYNILKHQDVHDLFRGWLIDGAWTGTATRVPSNSPLFKGITANSALNPINYIAKIDERPMVEYKLRALYAIWFEYYRVNELEPRSNDLWEYRNFTSVSLFSASTIVTAIAVLLPLRVRSWQKDPFTTSQIDDISRHVYAPIYENPFGFTPTIDYSLDPVEIDSAGASSTDNSFTGQPWSDVTIQYKSLSGSDSSVVCPLPSSLSRALPNFKQTTESVFALDLFTLKKAKMLENYLKRNFAFGDEYRDRMKAHYNVTIEDYRINRPVYLSGSVKSVDIKQEVANTGAAIDSSSNDMVKQGARLATGTADNNGVSDGFEFFSTEFGVYISLLSIVPRPQYDSTDPQNYQMKTMDFPTPEFAASQEDINNTCEIYRQGLVSSVDFKPFGHVPYAHGYRYRVDSVHGQMLSSKYDYTFARFFHGLTEDLTAGNANGVPKLNYWFLHCRPNIPMFANRILLDGQFYGTLKHNFLVEHTLPEPIETI